MPDFDLRKGTLAATVNMQNIAYHNSVNNADIIADLTFKIEFDISDSGVLDAVYLYLPDDLITESLKVTYEYEYKRVRIARY